MSVIRKLNLHPSDIPPFPSTASKLLERVDAPPEDLSPSSTLTRSLGLLRDLLLSHDASIASIEDRKMQFKNITHILVDALVQMVQVRVVGCDSRVGGVGFCFGRQGKERL